MRLILACGLLLQLSAVADDIVLLDDVNGKEVQVFGTALIKANQKYTEAKELEAGKNAPLRVHREARAYAQGTLRLNAEASFHFATEMVESPGGAERLSAHGEWYRFASRELRLDSATSMEFSNAKSQLPRHKSLIEAYRNNYNYARGELRLSESEARAFSEKLMQKLLPEAQRSNQDRRS